MRTYTLKMSGLSLREAKEIAEAGSTFMWCWEGEDLIAYPREDKHPAIISYEETQENAS